jgi:hypothetical protein
VTPQHRLRLRATCSVLANARIEAAGLRLLRDSAVRPDPAVTTISVASSSSVIRQAASTAAFVIGSTNPDNGEPPPPG